MILLICKMIFLGVCWVMLWRVAVSDKMIFEKVGKWAEAKVDKGHKVYDLFICPWCMGSVHGILFIWPLAFAMRILPFEWNWDYVCMYPFYLGGTSFISGMLWHIYLTMNQKKDYYESGVTFHQNAQKFFYNKNKKDKEEVKK